MAIKSKEMPLPPLRIEVPASAEGPGPEKKVPMYGYLPMGLAGHFTVYRMDVPITDARLVVVAERLPKRAAFEKVLFLVREHLFRAVLRYKRPEQGV